MRTTLLIAGLLYGASALAATIQVSAPNAGTCNIRNAINAANTNTNVGTCVRTGAATEPDTINLPAAAYGTPLLTNPPYDDEDANVNGDLDITSAIIIQGVSVARTHLAAPDADRLFDVRSGGALTLRDMTIHGGSVVASQNPFGGAIHKLSGGSLSLQRVVVRGGVAERGGGIYGSMQSGAISLRDVTIVDAFASVQGGGMALSAPPSAVLTELVNVTISGNAAPDGSGLYISFAPLRMRNSTVAFNRSTSTPGPAVRYDGSAPAQTVEFVNSVLSDNTNAAGNSSDLSCNAGIQLALRAYTLIGSIQACTFATTSGTPGSEPRLLPLFDYGGGIPVHAFNDGSAASNAGISGGSLGCTAADARGVPRTTTCDIGAYEESFDVLINSTADLPDLDPGDGLCRAIGDVCTLRAASMEANALGGRWFVGLPAGTYVLSRAIGGNDDSGGDLDIRPASASTPPLAFTLFGLGTPADTHLVGGGVERVLEVRGRFGRDPSGRSINRSVSFALIDATVRNGRQAFDAYLVDRVNEQTGGGGISLVGGHSLFYNVVVRDNELRAIPDPDQTYAQGAGISAVMSRADSDSYRYVSSARFERFALLDNLGFGEPAGVNLLLGGGAYVYGSDTQYTDGVVFINGTIAGNQADSGAGLLVEAKTASSFLTVHDNFVPADSVTLPSPGVYASNDGLSSFRNTVIAGNRFGALPRDCTATLTTLGRVLIGNDTGCTLVGDTTGNLLNVDPLLGTRQSAPGGMPFHRLGQGSPALDAVPLNRCSDSRGQGLRTDALGAARPAVAATPCDLGAIEGAALPDMILSDGFEFP
jgi:hypothetical protein